jgi:tetrapyrrole methylase family protein/MazG family protein
LAGITILGLGPGDPNLITRQVWEVLQDTEEVYLRTSQHAAVASFSADLQVKSFDHLYTGSLSPAEITDQIVTQVINLGHRVQGVIYGVPGHPYVAEATVTGIIHQAEVVGLPVRVIEGLSFLGPVLAALGQDFTPHITLVDSHEIAAAYHPTFSPNSPVMVSSLYSRQIVAQVKQTLMSVYPEDHQVHLLHFSVSMEMKPPITPLLEHTRLAEIDQSAYLGLLTHLYLPPLSRTSSFEAFQEIVAHLRALDGCPWDREQTHQSLRSHLLSESYEVLSALDANDPKMLREELGDLLLQIVLHAQIAVEAGEFTMEDVLNGIHTKIVRRHPHVFGDLELTDVQGVLRNWEILKASEREINHDTKGLLDGVPLALPALVQAQEYQERANRVGFHLPELEDIYSRITVELEALRKCNNNGARLEKLGDLVFAITSLACYYQVDIESALREANTRFRARFARIE